jgi:hypothetical protein
MKSFVHYNSRGTVQAIITVQAPEKLTVMLTPKSGHFVAEVNKMSGANNATLDLNWLRMLARSQKVDVTLRQLTLSAKTG